MAPSAKFEVIRSRGRDIIHGHEHAASHLCKKFCRTDARAVISSPRASTRGVDAANASELRPYFRGDARFARPMP